MPSASIGKVSVLLTANSKGFTRGMKRAERSVSTFQQRMTTMNQRLTLLAGGAWLAGVLALSRAFERMGTESTKLAEAFGAGDMTLGQFASRLTGTVPVLGDVYRGLLGIREATAAVMQAWEVALQSKFGFGSQQWLSRMIKSGDTLEKLLPTLDKLRRGAELGALEGPALERRKGELELQDRIAELNEARKLAHEQLEGDDLAFALERADRIEKQLIANHKKFVRDLEQATKQAIEDRRTADINARFQAELDFAEAEAQAAADAIKVAAEETEKQRDALEKRLEEARRDFEKGVAQIKRQGQRPRFSAPTITRGSRADFQSAIYAREAATSDLYTKQQLDELRDMKMTLRRIERNLRLELETLPT